MNINPEDYRILIVDDTTANVRLLSHVLEKEGYAVLSAYNGEEAIRLTREEKPDLILLDVMMPGMSGFEVASELKEDDKLADIPIIFLSALSESDIKVKGFKSGGVDYITKPFKKEETLARIQTHLHLQTLQNTLNEQIDELRLRESELSILNKQKDNLVRMVSHDIKNPLTGILGLVKMMRSNDRISAEEREQMFLIIEDSGVKLLNLVKQMLDKEENRNAREVLNLEETDLPGLANSIYEMHKAKSVLKEIELALDLDLICDTAVMDGSKMEIALGNLVSNALKFTKPGGKVSLRMCDDTKGDLTFKVTDTGIGIPEKLKNNIFLSAERSSTLGTGGESGTGLGLDIVQHYVNMHKGTVSVESEVNRGTTFIIEIPAIKNQK